MKNVIEQIHHEIKTAYLEAVADFNNNDHVEKNHYLKLKELGFKNAKFEQESIKSAEKNIQTEIYNFIKDVKIDYPYKKFITYKKLFEIVSKYGLVIDIPENFIGEIPEKNIKDIAEFEFKEKYVSLIAGNVLYNPNSNSNCYRTFLVSDDEKRIVITKNSSISFNKYIKKGDFIYEFNESDSIDYCRKNELQIKHDLTGIDRVIIYPVLVYRLFYTSDMSKIKIEGYGEQYYISSISDHNYETDIFIDSALRFQKGGGFVNNRSSSGTLSSNITHEKYGDVVFEKYIPNKPYPVYAFSAVNYSTDKRFWIVATPDQFKWYVTDKTIAINGKMVHVDLDEKIDTIVKEDPIVLFPTALGCIIVTAWGDEAEIPGIKNESFN